MDRQYGLKNIASSYFAKGSQPEQWRCWDIETHKPCSCCCPKSCPSLEFTENWKRLDAETETLR